MPDCLFCRIAAHENPADVVYEDEAVIAFKDIYPKAPVHFLIVPKRHVASIMDLEPADAELIGRCFLVARQLGELTGFAQRGYRISVNCGPEGGQVVYHIHFHFPREIPWGPSLTSTSTTYFRAEMAASAFSFAVFMSPALQAASASLTIPAILLRSVAPLGAPADDRGACTS